MINRIKEGIKILGWEFWVILLCVMITGGIIGYLLK